MNSIYIKKRQQIMDGMVVYYEDFILQAIKKLKNKKNERLLAKSGGSISNDMAKELVHDVLFDFCMKLKTEEDIDRFYHIFENKKLKAYIGKAISINAVSVKAPFLREKLKQFNRIEIGDIFYSIEKEPEEENDEEIVLSRVRELLKPSNAQNLLGKRWRFCLDLTLDYFNNKESTYSSISKKYGIPKHSVLWAIVYTRNKLRKQLISEGLDLKNRKIKYNPATYEKDID